MAIPLEDWIAVLDALLNNDRVAVAKVTNVITNYLARYGAYALRDSWDDICQEVLIRLIKSHLNGAIREPAAFVGFTDVIVRNLVTDWFKKGKPPPNPSGQLKTPEGGLSNVDVLVDLWHALQNLPGDLREVVEAIYIQGHSYEEAAERLDMASGTLRGRRTEGLKVLRKKMGLQMANRPLSEAALKEFLHKMRNEGESS